MTTTPTSLLIGIQHPPLNDPIPKLLDKYGGAAGLKPVVIDFCTRVLTNPSTRRCYGDLAIPQVLEHSFAVFAAILGKPPASYDFTVMRKVFDQSFVTQHAYEEMVLMVRQVLLDAGFSSRDSCIAVNVLDIYCESIFGIKLSRVVTSPFAGVDRRRVPRKSSSPAA